MVLLSHSSGDTEHSERYISEGTSELSDEKRSLALFVKQVMNVFLKNHEYEIKVVSAKEDEVIALKKYTSVLPHAQLYVLIEAKSISNQVTRLAKFINKNIFVVNPNLICWTEGNFCRTSVSEMSISQKSDLSDFNRNVIFRKSKTILPLWLDKYLFEELGALYAPEHSRYEYNLDLNEDELKVYLGTYFPRSYAEMFCIFDNIFQNNAIQQVYCNKKNINIFDFCCGTGGELIGLLSAIDKYFQDEKYINVVVCDGNELALGYLHKIMDKASSLSKHKYKFLAIHKEIHNLDDVENLDIPYNSFDIELCDKVCCEFISHGVNKLSYEYLAGYLSKKICYDGLLVILDVTTRCEDTMMFYPQMMNLQINNFLRNSNDFETLLPLSCATYKDCNIPCFTQQTFRVTHLQKRNDESRVCYRIICHKELKKYLQPNSSGKNKKYIINPIRYQQKADGAYCDNSTENINKVDSFNINN